MAKWPTIVDALSSTEHTRSRVLLDRSKCSMKKVAQANCFHVEQFAPEAEDKSTSSGTEER